MARYRKKTRGYRRKGRKSRVRSRKKRSRRTTKKKLSTMVRKAVSAATRTVRKKSSTFQRAKEYQVLVNEKNPFANTSPHLSVMWADNTIVNTLFQLLLPNTLPNSQPEWLNNITGHTATSYASPMIPKTLGEIYGWDIRYQIEVKDSAGAVMDPTEHVTFEWYLIRDREHCRVAASADHNSQLVRTAHDAPHYNLGGNIVDPNSSTDWSNRYHAATRNYRDHILEQVWADFEAPKLQRWRHPKFYNKYQATKVASQTYSTKRPATNHRFFVRASKRIMYTPEIQMLNYAYNVHTGTDGTTTTANKLDAHLLSNTDGTVGRGTSYTAGNIPYLPCFDDTIGAGDYYRSIYQAGPNVQTDEKVNSNNLGSRKGVRNAIPGQKYWLHLRVKCKDNKTLVKIGNLKIVCKYAYNKKFFSDEVQPNTQYRTYAETYGNDDLKMNTSDVAYNATS
jgi:hypothetical protein